jgi:hypothetical protein
MAPPNDPYSDFRNWLWRVWKHLNLPDPTPIQYDIAVYLQHGPSRAIIQAFRGVGKSWVTAAYVTWVLRADPDHKILVASAAKDRADAFSTFTKRLIAELPELRHLAPRPGQRDSMVAFDVGPARADQSPSVKSVGIFGQITGSRADTIIADDVETPNTAETQGQREKLAERVREFDAVLKPGGRVLFLGTPQTEMTLYGELEKRGYATRIWPARVPSKKQLTAYGDRLAPLILEMAEKVREGATTEPRRFSDEDLLAREISWGRAGFQLQFMLDPSLADVDRYPLKLGDLVVLGCHPELAPTRIVWASGPEQAMPGPDEPGGLPNVGLRGDRWHRPMLVTKDEREWKPYTTTVMAVDPAGRGADEASFAVVSSLGANLFLRRVGGFSHGYSPESLSGFARIAKETGTRLVTVESNFGDGMFTELLRPVLAREAPGVGIEEVRHSRQKELRIIDTLEPVLAGHRLIVDPGVIREDYETVSRYPLEVRHHYRLFHQMTRITRDKGALRQDGRLDALAMAVGYFRDKLAMDQEEAASRAREEALDEELRKFLEGITGRAPRGPTWVDIPGG